MDNNDTYKIVNSENKKNFNFGKNVFVSFCSGVIGSALVLGTVYFVPNLRNSLNNGAKNEISNNTNIVSTEKSSTPTQNYVSLTNYSNTAISVAEKVQPSIVGIEVEFPVTSVFYRNTSTTTSSGSGIIISTDGYILTNNHIVSSSSNSSFYSLGEASSVKVYLYEDDTHYDAKIIGTDEKTDLAVLKIEKSDLTSAELGDSDSIKVGEFAMAIGNPMGLQSSVTCGVISGLNRNIKTSDATYNVIQTDAAINSGNSGGALVNADGKVIGVNTLKISSTGVEGIGFAIPINSTKKVYEDLINNGKVKRPYMGISGSTLDEDDAKKYNLVAGVYIRDISDFSPAQKSGLKVGDVITNVDNTKITTIDDLTNLISTHNIGDTITVTFYRNGNTENINLTLEEEV